MSSGNDDFGVNEFPGNDDFGVNDFPGNDEFGEDFSRGMMISRGMIFGE